MADDPLTIPDWLGRPQPLARKALELTSSGGGGAVTAPVTPGGTGPGGTLSGGGLTPPGPGPASGGSDLAKALQAASLGESGLKAASALMGPAGPDVSGTPNPVAPETPIAGPEGIEGAVSQLPSTSVPAGTAAAESAATFGAESAGGADAGGGSGGSALGAAGALAGLGLSTSAIAQSNMSDADKTAMAAHSALRAVADYASFGIPSILDEVIQLFGGPSGSSVFADVFGIGGGKYGPTRQKAGQEAGADLSRLSSVYRTAAESGDPAQVLTALSTGQGDRGAVRSALTLPPDVASKIGLPGPQVEWSALSPQQFSGVLDYFRQNPDAMNTAITGSGDVAYLNQQQAGQVADQAAQDARAVIQFMLSQGPAAPTATAPTAPGAAPTSPMPVSPGGPSGALGFATDLMQPV